MESVYNFLLHVYNTLPPPVAVALWAWAMSSTVTQVLKFMLPLEWNPKGRRYVAIYTAFFAAFLTAVVMMPTGIGCLVGVTMGVWSPLFYALTIAIVGHIFPWLADVLSGDVRGMIFGERREHK